AFVLASPPTGRMWDVFKGYAGRVRCLTLRTGEFLPSTISYFTSRLQSESDSPYLLPNLRQIGLEPDEPSSLSSIIHLLRPDFEAIELHLNVGCVRLTAERAAQIANALSARPLLCLARISILCGGFHVMEQGSLDPLFSLVHLQTNLAALELRHYRLTAEALSKLGQQTQLTQLIIENRGTSLEAAAAMFSTIGYLFPGLRTLKFSFDPRLNAEIGVSTIAGISSCHDLRSLEVGNSSEGFLTSHMVSEMGRWWPCMEEFGLVSYRYLARKIRTPLRRLYDIAQAWSITLRLLNVPFNLGWDFPPVSEAMAVKFRHLKSITIISTVLLPNLCEEKYSSIAEFLAAITNPHFSVHESLDLSSSPEYAALNQRIKEMREAQ
ncbi:hypothetical protein FS837_001359, partial [Tulasnella sp. UAMH 9824]